MNDIDQEYTVTNDSILHEKRITNCKKSAFEAREMT